MEYVEEEPILKRPVVGPMFKAKCYNKYCVNGHVFSPVDYETNKSTQNSGVSMKAFILYKVSVKDKKYKEVETTYYGVVKQIIGLDYIDFCQTIFYCDWFKAVDKTNGCIVDSDTNLTMVKRKN